MSRLPHSRAWWLALLTILAVCWTAAACLAVVRDARARYLGPGLRRGETPAAADQPAPISDPSVHSPHHKPK